MARGRAAARICAIAGATANSSKEKARSRKRSGFFVWSRRAGRCSILRAWSARSPTAALSCSDSRAMDLATSWSRRAERRIAGSSRKGASKTERAARSRHCGRWAKKRACAHGSSDVSDRSSRRRRESGSELRTSSWLTTAERSPLERRRVRWLAFDEAIQALDLGKSRRVLRAAHRLTTLAEPRRHRLQRAVARLGAWLAFVARALKRSLAGLVRRSGRV